MKHFILLSIGLFLSSVLFAQKEIELDFNIKGSLRDSYTKKKLEGAKVVLFGPGGRKTEFVTPKNGKFHFDNDEFGNPYLDAGFDYKLVIEMKGYKTIEHEESTKDLDQSETFQLDFLMERIKKF
ncbi:MAG: carboxypeptidase-like regulatory domain-containing protein [Flavobacteriales bacterium]|nr:carboxypeptidase-like regulatory domain-containing protein [Flavobacteriales bacterium]